MAWDHLFHGETFDANVPWAWESAPPHTVPARQINPPPGYPANMGVFSGGKPVALGALSPNTSPPLREVATYEPVAVWKAGVVDVGTSWVFDFGVNMAGMTRP